MKITRLLDRNKITIRRQHSEFARLANHLNDRRCERAHIIEPSNSKWTMVGKLLRAKRQPVLRTASRRIIIGSA